MHGGKALVQTKLVQIQALLKTLQWFTISPSDSLLFQKPTRLHKSCSPNVLTASPSLCTCPCSLASPQQCLNYSQNVIRQPPAWRFCTCSAWNTRPPHISKPTVFPLSGFHKITASQGGFFLTTNFGHILCDTLSCLFFCFVLFPPEHLSHLRHYIYPYLFLLTDSLLLECSMRSEIYSQHPKHSLVTCQHSDVC